MFLREDPWASSPKIRPTTLWVVRRLAGYVLGNEKKKVSVGASLSISRYVPKEQATQVVHKGVQSKDFWIALDIQNDAAIKQET